MFDSILQIINKVIPDQDAARKVALEMEKEVSKQMALKAEVIKNETQLGGLAAYWRPVTMVIFLSMLVLHWVMYDILPYAIVVLDLDYIIPQDMGLTDGFLDLIELGLMGYIGGRSAEKIAKDWKK